MNIVVKVEQVPDTYSERQLASHGTLDRDATEAVLDEIDEWAVETALQLKEAGAGPGDDSTVTVVTRRSARGGADVPPRSRPAASCTTRSTGCSAGDRISLPRGRSHRRTGPPAGAVVADDTSPGRRSPQRHVGEVEVRKQRADIGVPIRALSGRHVEQLDDRDDQDVRGGVLAGSGMSGARVVEHDPDVHREDQAADHCGDECDLAEHDEPGHAQL